MLPILRAGLFCLSLFSTVLQAKPLTIGQALQHAVENHVQLKIAREEQTLRWYELKIQRQKFRPSLTLNASATLQNEDYFSERFQQKKIHVYPVLRFHTPWGTQLELYGDQSMGYEPSQSKKANALRVVFEQPLLQGNSYHVNTWSIENAKCLQEIQTWVMYQKINQVVYQGLVLYFSLIMQYQDKRLQEKRLTHQTRFHENLKVRIEAGRAPAQDLQVSSLQIKQFQHQLQQSDFEYRQSKRKFLEHIGWEATEAEIEIEHTALEAMMIGKESASKQILDWDQESLLALILNNDIEYKILHLNKVRLEHQWALEKEKQPFDLALRGDWTIGRYHVYGKGLNSTLLGSENDVNAYAFPYVHNRGNYSLQLLFTFPIVSSLQRQLPSVTLQAEVNKQRYEIAQHERYLQHYVHNLIEQIHMKKTQLMLSEEALALAERSYHNAQEKLEAGRTGMFELLVYLDRCQDAKHRLHQERIAYFEALINLDLVTGVLAEKWIKLQ